LFNRTVKLKLSVKSIIYVKNINMKTTLILGTLLISIINISAQQTASYDVNNTPVSGSNNSAFGYQSLNNTNTSVNNTAIGWSALFNASSGSNNTAVGMSAMLNNLTGSENVAIGIGALSANTAGGGNVALGVNALQSNQTGANVSIGYENLLNNNIGDHNSAIGYRAMLSNIDGYYNAATGANALHNNDYGYQNVAFGVTSLWTNTSGHHNSGLGYNTDVGSSNLYNATALGNGAVVNISDKIRLGDGNISVIEGQVAYSFPSDARFKTNIKEDDVKGLEFILKLRPVVYNFDSYKFQQFLTKNMPDSVKKRHFTADFTKSTAVRQSGFLAQEVEKAANEVGYDFNGIHKPENENDNYSLAYSQFVVPMVKAIQEQQKLIENQEQKIAALLAKVETLTGQKATNVGGNATGIEPNAIGSKDFSLEQNEPNPFTRETIVKFTLPQTVSSAYLAVYDLSGKQITTFPIADKGVSSLTITSEKLAAGIYIYSIIADGKILDSKRMIVAQK
jgi:trimeric autotransporter adhesin